MAVGTVAYTLKDTGKNSKIIQIDWVSGASNGTVPQGNNATIVASIRDEWGVALVVTKAASPATVYNITLTDDSGVDIMGGELAGRSATSIQQASPKIGSQYDIRPLFYSNLYFNLTGCSAGTITGQCLIGLVRLLDDDDD